MHYEYTIYEPGSTEQVAVTLFMAEPLAHLTVGNSLQLEGENYSTVAGYHLVIRHVEIYMNAPIEEAQPARMRVSVFTSERARSEIPEMLEEAPWMALGR
ncbi:MAG: hypothetical protein JWN73_4192 [Betaproteobacteria bacterium]|nr:hypothetical protein [Betaproteobacteria bacterium]